MLLRSFTFNDKVTELEAIFWRQAEANNVYYPGQIALPDAACPPVLNKSFTITADITVPEKDAQGMIIT